MLPINFIYLILFTILSVSIILSIINWLNLISINTKIGQLELEIDKKALEFDNLRKERQTIVHSDPIAVIPDESAHEMSSSTSSQESIQIMRNVRGNFQMADHNSYETQEIKESAYMQQNNSTTVHQQLYTSSDDNILDIVGDNHLSAKNKPILLSLYSESSKDADFASLWQKTSSILSSNPTPEIEIDFTGISFLYNKEFDYLEKIRSIITAPGGRLTIVHCDPEVVSLMNNHPNLIKITEEKNL